MGMLVFGVLLIHPIIFLLLKCNIWVRYIAAIATWCFLYKSSNDAEVHIMGNNSHHYFLWISLAYFVFAWAMVKTINAGLWDNRYWYKTKAK